MGGTEEEADLIPVSTERADPPKALELSDIMAMLKQSMSQNTNRFDRLDREQAAVRQEAREGKETGAKATTIATETRKQLTDLEKRVSQVEKNPMKTAPPPGLARGRGMGSQGGGRAGKKRLGLFRRRRGGYGNSHRL